MSKYTPGLELDRLIAEKVLGWYHESDVGGPRAWWFSPEDSVHAKELPQFSMDIKAAWQLVERFKLCVMPFNKDLWTAFPVNVYPGDTVKYAAIDAPHAICLAALAEVEDDH